MFLSCSFIVDTVSLWSLGWPGAHHIDLPARTSQEYTTTPSLDLFLRQSLAGLRLASLLFLPQMLGLQACVPSPGSHSAFECDHDRYREGCSVQPAIPVHLCVDCCLPLVHAFSCSEHCHDSCRFLHHPCGPASSSLCSSMPTLSHLTVCLGQPHPWALGPFHGPLISQGLAIPHLLQRALKNQQHRTLLRPRGLVSGRHQSVLGCDLDSRLFLFPHSDCLWLDSLKKRVF